MMAFQDEEKRGDGVSAPAGALKRGEARAERCASETDETDASGSHTHLKRENSSPQKSALAPATQLATSTQLAASWCQEYPADIDTDIDRSAQRAPWSTSVHGAAEWCEENPPDTEIDDDEWSADWHVPHLNIRLEDTDFLAQCAREATEMLIDFV